MRYSLLLHYPEMSPEQLSPEALKQGQDAFDAFASAAQSAGVLVSAEMFHPAAAATTVSLVDDALAVKHGAYAHTIEQLGGVIVVEVSDQVAAISWAEKAPSVHWGTVELRESAVHWTGSSWAS